MQLFVHQPFIKGRGWSRSFARVLPFPHPSRRVGARLTPDPGASVICVTQPIHTWSTRYSSGQIHAVISTRQYRCDGLGR